MISSFRQSLSCMCRVGLCFDIKRSVFSSAKCVTDMVICICSRIFMKLVRVQLPVNLVRNSVQDNR